MLELSAKTLLLALLNMNAATAVHQGALQIEEDGVPIDLHVVSLAEDGEMIHTHGREMKLRWGGETRAFLAEKRRDDMPVNNYFNFTLLNKELSYDIDLSAVGCSCNAALFFVSMPGHHPNGSIAHGDMNPYYCDANEIGGVWCWEHDTIEGNKHTMATTPHTCDAPPGKYTSSCHKEGCRVNAFDVDPKGMCPDASCKIDTRKQFRLFQRYLVDPETNKLVRISNRLEQGSANFEWDSCSDPVYLEQMTAALSNNMTMVFQLWGDKYKKMEWLDDMVGCKEECVPANTTVTFSNIALRSLGTDSDEALIVV